MKKMMMGKILEEENNKYWYCMESLEEKISVYYVEEFDNETNRFHEEEEDDNGSDDLTSNNTSSNIELLHGDGDGDGESHPSTKRILFWESQQALLQEIMERQNLTGQKLRREVNRIVELVREKEFCSCCPNPSSDGFCTYCLRRILVNRLCEKGFNANLCESKWKRTKDIPGGTHEYIEVMTITPGRNKQLPFLIELEFRDQFEIAKACDEYWKLVSQLPEYYIGKPEYLKTMVRILCNAAKQSMKEKKIYMGPWRKRSFMQMKWSHSFEKKNHPLNQSLNKFSLVSPRQPHDSCLHLSTAPVAVT